MTLCEFKAECVEATHDSDCADWYESCTWRKFAILIHNQAIEELEALAKEYATSFERGAFAHFIEVLKALRKKVKE